jgi:hypothetical protein
VNIACEKVATDYLNALERVEFHFGKSGGLTPITTPLKGLTGAGSAKMVYKTLSRNELKVKILITKELPSLAVIRTYRLRLGDD